MSSAEVAALLNDSPSRYMLEMEGINAYGIRDFSDWELFRSHLRKSFEYGKQRCTAYTRFVVQRSIFPEFLDAYLTTVRTLRVGHPLVVEDPDAPAPEVDFGPLINATAAEALRVRRAEALAGGR